VYLDATPVARVKDGVVIPLEADHLGSPRVMQEPDGSGTAWSWNLLANSASGSNAFGEQAPTGKQSFSLRFPGQFADGNGLSYNYFRDYEAGTGRYVESDPIGLAGGVGTFGYVEQHPITTRDFFGLMGYMGMPPDYGHKPYNPPILPPCKDKDDCEWVCTQERRVCNRAKYIAGTLAASALIFSLVPEPTVSKGCALGAGVGAAVFGGAAVIAEWYCDESEGDCKNRCRATCPKK